MKLKREVIEVDERGGIILPQWAVNLLLKEAGVRSRKKRIQKKVVKKLFLKKLLQSLKK